MKILITGGCGFIGANLVKLALKSGYEVVNVDALTYAGNLDSLADVAKNAAYTFIHGDICDNELLNSVFAQHAPQAVLHLAAESHVDRSIDGPETFVQTNIVGTFRLLEAARGYWTSLSMEARKAFRFIHVSTDEVFGSLGPDRYFSEVSPYDPRSPYSASKASSDHLARSYYHTYGLPVIVSNCSNNYGPYQYPEKLIPLTILKALQGQKIPVYGDGMNVRDWLFVEDHCRALLRILEMGIPGETYVIGGNSERTNLRIVQTICALLDELRPNADLHSYENQIAFVADRPGHDKRYAIDADKIFRELQWTPLVGFDEGMRKTVEWYLNKNEWVQRILDKKYSLERLGLEGVVKS